MVSESFRVLTRVSELWSIFLFVANISMSFNILARVTIFAALSYLIYTTISGLLIDISTPPIRTPAKPTSMYMSLANRLLNSTTTLLVKFKVLDQRGLRPCQGNANDSPLPLALAVSAQRFVSWLLASDRLSTYYPILMVVSMCHKVALSSLRSATGARPSLCIAHKAVLLVLILGFTASVRSLAVLTRISALNQAALVAPGLATTLGLDMLVSLPSLALWYARGESKVFNSLLDSDPDALTTSPVADSGRVCDWSYNSRVLLLLRQGFPRPAIPCKHITWHWGPGLDYHASRGVWRAAVPVSGCISASLNRQHSRILTLSVHVHTCHNAA